jgi:hypothetical protein
VYWRVRHFFGQRGSCSHSANGKRGTGGVNPRKTNRLQNFADVDEAGCGLYIQEETGEMINDCFSNNFEHDLVFKKILPLPYI